MRLWLLILTGCGGSVLETGSEIESLRHEVEYEVDEGVARLTVRRAFRGVEDALDLKIELPSGGAIDRFRFGIDDRWTDGVLLDAEAAAERYDLLSGLAGKDGYAVEGAPPPALLGYDDGGALEVSAHPIAPSDLIEIEYRVVIPTCHAEGREMFDYPIDPTDRPRFIGRGLVREPYDEDYFRYEACDENTSMVGGDSVVIETEPLTDPMLTYAVQTVGDRHALRLALDAPPELAPIPTAPTVVFVLDGSYSQGRAGLSDQLAWAKAYLSWVPDAEVEVVVFRREAERLFGRLLPAREFESALAAISPERLAPGNGSFLDEGISLAVSIAEGRSGEKRIVAMSDLLLRERFAPGTIPLDGSAVIHVLHRGEPTTIEPHLFLDDGGDAGELALATGGVSVDLAGDPMEETAAEIMEELVHPIRLDAIEVVGLDEVVPPGDSVDRGGHLRFTALVQSRPSERIEVRAKLWSKPISFEVTTSRSVGDAMPAILWSTATALSDEELALVAHAGGVVTRLTSYLAERGGVDPVANPVEVDDIYGISGIGVSGIGCGCRCGGVVTHSRIDDVWLRDRMRELAASCGAVEGEATVETTYDEIADVLVTAREGEECLREALWELRLPEIYRPSYENPHAGRMTVTLNL